MSTHHPKRNERGALVAILRPSVPTPLATWLDAAAHASVVPGGPLPPALNGIGFAPWDDAPRSAADWMALADRRIAEPDFCPHSALKAAAGVVVEEADGRVWLVAPTNRYGGYSATFPKGRVEDGLSLAASALKETFEEAGLRVAISGFLLDCDRSETRTRYYRARRLGGSPADMGWESQAVHLVPRARLAELLTNPHDRPLLAALAT